MASGTISRGIITKDYTYTWPAFDAGNVGSRIDSKTWVNAVPSGYKTIAASFVGLIPSYTFTATLSYNDNNIYVARNRASGTGEVNTFDMTVRVVYQKT